MFRPKPKILVLFVSTIILTILLTTLVIQATTVIPSTIVISSGLYPGAPDYTVWKEGSAYFAKNANGLLASFSGTTNATDMALGVLALGGNILFKAGEYDMTFGDTGFFPLVDNTYLHGEPGTIWNLGGVGSSVTCFRQANHPNRNYNITIQNIELRLANPKTYSILITNGSNILIDHVTSSGGDIYIYNSEDVTVQYCKLSDPVVDAISFFSVTDTFVQFNEIRDMNGSFAIRSMYGGNRTIISNNIIRNSNYGGIVVDSDDSFPQQQTVVSYNTIDNIQGLVAGIEIAKAYDTDVLRNLIVNVVGNNIVNCNYSINVERAHGVSVTGNTIINSTYYGIKLFGSDDIASGNVILNSGAGIWLPQTSNCSIIGNTISATDYGIGLDYGYTFSAQSCNTSIIMGNKISGPTYGIYLNSTCSYNIVIGDNTRDCTYGIVDVGTGNHVNLCWNATVWIG